MTDANTAYSDLEALFARANRIDEAAGWLHWDQSVTMPAGGAEARGEQAAALAEVAHEIVSAPKIGDLLDAATTSGDAWRQANLREMRRLHINATAIPSDLVGALTRARATAETAWRAARPAADFSQALPAFRDLLSLARQEAQALGAALNLSPYDALLSQYDPGRSAADIRPVFDRLRDFLAGAIPEIVGRQAAWGRIPAIQAPASAQRKAATALLRAIGFDFHHGRLDDSLHPFSTGTAEDARITARWDENDALSGLMAVLHEAGHAAYTRGQPKAWRGQPVGGDAGMTAHESQSLTFEMQAGRTPAMSGFLAGLLAEASGGQVDPVNIERNLLQVAPGYIRVDADEATYPIHVILRFELEQALIAGDLDPSDLPGAWNERITEYLGLPAPDDREGCLQDIHWFDGAFGYFPTYTLGALAAAQLYAAANEAIGPDVLTAALSQGDYAPLAEWMGAHVHSLGRLHPSSDDILTAATGATLAPDAFEAHIRRRYLGDA